MRIRTGDTVEVVSGDHIGERGQVQRVVYGPRNSKDDRRDPSKTRLVVAGVNLVFKHQRRTGSVRTQVGIIQREAPLHVSNVMLVCPTCDEATRVGVRVFEDDTKTRYCKKCDSLID